MRRKNWNIPPPIKYMPPNPGRPMPYPPNPMPYPYPGATTTLGADLMVAPPRMDGREDGRLARAENPDRPPARPPDAARASWGVAAGTATISAAAIAATAAALARDDGRTNDPSSSCADSEPLRADPPHVTLTRV